jgi:hypothetical protein
MADRLKISVSEKVELDPIWSMQHGLVHGVEVDPTVMHLPADINDCDLLPDEDVDTPRIRARTVRIDIC